MKLCLERKENERETAKWHNYITNRSVQAMPMDRDTYIWQEYGCVNHASPNKPGYIVRFDDDSTTWVPDLIFHEWGYQPEAT